MPYIKPFSYDAFLTYKIKKGDTPENVALQLGIDLYELRSYHNKYCPLKDCIGPTFPMHLEFVILQSEEDKKAKEAHRENIRFSSQDFKLPFRPAGLNKKYLAMYIIENGNEKHTLKEEINVKWLATDANEYSFFEINRISKVYVDDNENNTIADELAEKTAKVFYPLEVVVDSNGEWISIHNFDDIRERWHDLKKEIVKEFQGEVVKERLQNFENRLENNAMILSAFSKDWFLRAFFNGINIEYEKTLTVKYEIKFPVSQKVGDVKFLTEQSILPIVDKYNLVNIIQKGILADDRSKDDFENDLPFSYNNIEEGAEKAEGTYTAYYFLNPNRNTVDSLFMECEVKLDTPQKTTIIISSLDNKGKLMVDSEIQLYVPKDLKVDKINREIFWMIIAVIVIVVVGAYVVLKLYSNT